MNELPHAEAFRAFGRAPHDAVGGALLVGRLVDPTCDDAWVRDELARLAATVATADGTAVLAALAGAGFAGAERYYSRDNSSIAHVLRTRRGIPITLAVVAIGVAAGCGLPARGINLPGHFLVEVDDVLADPFRMTPIPAAQRHAWLERAGLSPAQGFPPATPRDIVLRMLNNLRALAVERGQPAEALDLSGYQLLLAPDPLPFHLERIELWLAAGVVEMARREIDLALACTGDEALRGRLAERRVALADAAPRLH